jgi:hypothetical protein
MAVTLSPIAFLGDTDYIRTIIIVLIFSNEQLYFTQCFNEVLNFRLISVFYYFYVFLQPFGCFFIIKCSYSFIDAWKSLPANVNAVTLHDFYRKLDDVGFNHFFVLCYSISHDNSLSS